LIAGVYTGYSGERDVSQSVVDIAVQHHRDAKVDVMGRGLRDYRALNLTEGRRNELSMSRQEIINAGLKEARNEHIIVINGDDLMVSVHYGASNFTLTARI
jgi:hypothetical protein